MYTKKLPLRVLYKDVPKVRTFVVDFISTLEGYEARVSEWVSPDELVPMALDMPPRQEIDAGTFYRDRPRYRAFLFDSICAELDEGKLRAPLAGDRRPVLHATVAANLIGWKDRPHPDACDDNLQDWDPLAERNGGQS